MAWWLPQQRGVKKPKSTKGKGTLLAKLEAFAEQQKREVCCGWCECNAGREGWGMAKGNPMFGYVLLCEQSEASVVQLGDASIASPFTSRRPTIECSTFHVVRYPSLPRHTHTRTC